ncbi:hypothetical protein [Streptomyces anthocyanicus]|uniref:hypothetical protein n=1 Tax=Streptomyces anthocyanicus TaxID=68174 RepID=UPI00177CF291|nr:hypothetical protein [Streptomyces anthocyanicus]WTC47404.1 hypothetical protein OG855_06505 [Streptomyces anthocyanicus]GHA53301.1 hypothetical protein GCM10010391_42870 [Streptomyces anthocyanicus]
MDFTPYAEWQRVLEEAFFSPAWDGHPVVMYMDDDEAARMQRSLNLEVPLAEAVRRVIAVSSTKPYELIEQYERVHRSDDRAPAVLPLLACSVIAATRMANDGVRRATNFHSHFSQLLAGREGILTSAKHQSVAGMWQRLASWQHRWGTYRGICTIPSPADLPHNQARIGFALSQAVLQGTDRQLLPKFFEAVRQHHRTVWPLPGAVLVEYLEKWGQAYFFSPKFLQAVKHPEFRPLVERILGNFANVWDGSPYFVAQGIPRAELLVCFQNRKLGWLAKLSKPGEPEYELSDAVHMRRLGETGYYALDGLKLPDDRSLRTGVQLAGQGIVVGRPASSLVVLRQNNDLDCLTSVDRFVPGEQHMLLAAPEAQRDVEVVLQRAAAPGVEPKRGRLSWMPEGWSLHHRVVFDDAVTLRQAIRDVQGAMLAVQPAPQYKPYLQGGLPLAPKFNKHLYLKGGEPDLVLPDGATGEALLDGQPPRPPFRARGVPVSLWRREMPAGQHRIHLEGAEVCFLTAEEAPAVADPERIAGFRHSGTQVDAFATTKDRDTGLLRGARLGQAGIGAVPQVTFCRRGAETTVFVASDGRAWEVAEPVTPTWWERLPETPSDYYFEVELRGCDGWIVQFRREAWHVDPVNPREPDFSAGPEHRGWAAAVLDAAEGSGDPLWQAYVRRAQEVRE